MTPDFFDVDDREPTLDQARRIVDDAARIAAAPPGPHLDDEALYRLASGTIGPHSSVFAHLESCPDCAAAAADALYEAERQAGNAAAPAATVSAYSAMERDEWLTLDLPVAAFAMAGGLSSTRYATRALEWRPSLSDPRLECALDEVRSAGGVVTDRAMFLARTSTSEWAERPLRFIVQDAATGSTIADSWIVLLRKSGDSEEFVGEAPIAAGRPAAWRAWIGRYAFVRDRAPTYQQIERLRNVIRAAGEADRAVWRRWLDAEAASGRLFEWIRAELLAGL